MAVPSGLGVETVVLGRESPKAIGLSKVGLWRELASDRVMQPPSALAVWEEAGAGGCGGGLKQQILPAQPGASSPSAFFSRTLDSHCGCLLSMSFCPRLLWEDSWSSLGLPHFAQMF